MKNILITGGAGFIGSHVVRLFVNKYSRCNIYNYDVLTYAGNLENLDDIKNAPNYKFIKGDICDESKLRKSFNDYDIDTVIHLAAESHVDRSISDPMSFVNTNVIGTVVLLNVAKEYWNDNYDDKLFYHVSTDEVFGTLGKTGLFHVNHRYDPRSPYAASKASSDHFIRAYKSTYNMPIIISNCSNNYGPNQFPEKLIPLFINNIINNKPLPVYGAGENVRDWLFVEDHAKAIDTIINSGKTGETYNIGGVNEWTNIDLIKLLCKIMDSKLGRKEGESEKLITYIEDRAGHDFRYAIDTAKIKRELYWSPSVTFEQGLDKTIDWYLDNKNWLKNVTSGKYRKYYKKQYGK